LLISTACAAEVSVRPFPPDGKAVLIVADGFAYIVRGTTPVYTWRVGDTPQPDPPVPPVPIPSKVSGVWIIEEQRDRTRAQAEVMDSVAWQSLAKSKNLRWGIEDDDNPDPRLSKIIAGARGASVPLPVVCLTDSDGEVVGVLPLPKTVEEMRALIGGIK
jgi:hypothetical protein